jgi:periplasmic protein TonB
MVDLRERLRSGAGRRTVGLCLTILIEALLLLALLTLGAEEQPGNKESRLTTVNFKTEEVSEDQAEPSSAEPEQRSEEQPAQPRPTTEEPSPPSPTEPKPVPAAPAIIPRSQTPLPSAALPPSPAPPAPSPKRVYGPPDKGGPAYSRDTERVGTAPNGEPLYAAAWYREPRDEELRAYLSTASGPGWGLIACRTAPDYRVEDCVALAEYPQGSQINRAIIAAAWEFKVRPPRLGGKSLVGSWVQIRIDYRIERRR